MVRDSTTENGLLSEGRRRPGRLDVPKDGAHLMDPAVIDQWNRCRVRWHTVEVGHRHATASPRWVRDGDHILRTLETPHNLILRPRRRDAWIDAESRAAPSKPEQTFETCAVHPASRARIPAPSTAAGMWRAGVHITSHHVRLGFIALHVTPVLVWLTGLSI